MINAYFKSSRAIIKIIVNKEDYNRLIKDEFLYSYIPSLSIGTYKKSDAIVELKKDKTNYIEFNYPYIVYHYTNFNSKDIISLIEYIFERARQEKNIICIHGAASIYDNKLVVAWGGTTGMGKTTFALELSKYGEFYSDEKVLLDLDKVMGVGSIKNQYISNDYWKKLYNTNSPYIKLANTKKEKYKINLLIHPIICNSNDYVLDKWDNDKFLWHLYEESSRKIRGTSRLFFDKNYPARSLDSFELASKRLELIKKFVHKVPCIYFKGNIENALKEIFNIHNK